MALDQQINIFTHALRGEFAKAYEETAVPAPYEKVTQIVPSTTKIEYYPWMSPVPGMSEYKGHRFYGKVESVIYSVRNLPYANAFMVPLDDVEDENFNVKGYMQKPKELAIRGKKFPSRAVIKLLSQGASTTAFDGVNFFANRSDGVSGAIGTGNNNLTFTAASGDGKSYKLAALFHGDILKPLLWQERLPARLMTNAGTPQSFESKQLRYWCDLRGAAAFGWWWDSCLVTITNTPNIAELYTIFANIETAFRSFVLPRAVVSEDGEYWFEQEEFNESNLCLVGSTGLAQLLRQALGQPWIPQMATTSAASTAVATTNLYHKWASYFVSAFMN